MTSCLPKRSKNCKNVLETNLIFKFFTACVLIFNIDPSFSTTLKQQLNRDFCLHHMTQANADLTGKKVIQKVASNLSAKSF
jgi:hypothetical protein